MAKNKKQKQAAAIAAPAIQPRMLTVGDAAKYLGIGPWAMRKLDWDGDLKGVMIGRRLMFDRFKLDSYIEKLQAVA